MRDLDPALRFAVQEAQVLDSSLRIVGHEGHVRGSPRGPSPPMERALRTARALAGGAMPITGELHPSPVLESAVHAHRDVQVVVVQRTDLGPLLEALGRVGPSARVPAVACVPPGWHASAASGRPITVAVDDPAVSHHLLGAALRIASTHGLPLRVVHAWVLSQPQDGAPLPEIATSAWSQRISDELGALREATDVFVNLDIQMAPPVQALVEHSRESTALLVGAGRAVYRSVPGPGLVTRDLLHHAACPVIVVPDTRASALHASARNGSSPPLAGHP